MARLIVLSEGEKGKAHELKVDRTTIGRVEDNTFQIPEASVSSHHCEIIRKGEEVIVKDLDSTNGTYINGEKITEATLKPGQTLRLGQVELKLDTGKGPVPSAPAAKSDKKTQVADQTMVIQRGVSLSELEQGPTSGFDTAGKAFSKKSNQVNRYFIIGGVVVGILIIGLLVYLAAIITKQ